MKLKEYKNILSAVMEVSKEYDVNFLRKIPFECFGSDEEETYMSSFSNYYREIFEKLNCNIETITTKEISDGKYMVRINNDYRLDVRAWDSLISVLDNVDFIIEAERYKLKQEDLSI